MKEKPLSNKLLWKLSLAFLLILFLVGLSHIFITAYYANRHQQETFQLLNADIASHLIEEKFKEERPFLEDGSVNKALFGDIMHDMMAVNRGIEVYLLGTDGRVRYSVVLDHDGPGAQDRFVDLQPINDFISSDTRQCIMGDDPLNPGKKKAFSAAKFDLQGQEGYIYIVLAGQVYDSISENLRVDYFLRVGSGATLLTLFFALLAGLLAIWFLTKNLRDVIDSARRFKEGDFNARVPNAEQSDLAVLATTFNEMADTIVANIEQIKAVDTLRQELIANVSHDLRTPLAVMQGYVETLQMKNDKLSAEDREKYLGIVLSSSERLSKLVGQLFEYSKLEARQIEPQKEPFFISELAQDIFHKYQILGKEKGVAIRLDAPRDLPLVFADVGLVERVIQNLMDNALKFTPEGGEVSLSLRESKHNVEIRISDTGPGIPQHEQAYIFERYHKMDRSKAKNTGVGLGLAIVKKILEIHDATIEVSNRPEKGAVFRFELPAFVGG